VARIVADQLGWNLSDRDLVQMATTNPGDALALSWRRQIGRLQPSAIGDLVVVRAAAGADPFATLVGATEADVELVVVAGRARYGRGSLMAKAGASDTTAVKVAGLSRKLALTRSDDAGQPWSWEEVVARLEEVRADPKGEIERARDALAPFAGRLHDPGAPLRLALDMPSGVAPVGGLPKDLSRIVVPPLEGLAHDDQFLDLLPNRGFHGGVLNRLADFYR
jgi:5-methylthioadenosine/S-adenosylhomocysteine deaminase